VKTVGVKGDARSYGYSIVVRGVETSDFMTARGYYFPKEAAEEITNRVTKAREVVRVWFDMTPKPPATTELE
jgi:GMP synthase (glutamine-hydrolysing)